MAHVLRLGEVRKLISIFWLHLHFQIIKWYVHNDQLKLRRVLVSVSILVAKMFLWGSFFQMPTGIYICVISDPLSQSSKKNDRLENTSGHVSHGNTSGHVSHELPRKMIMSHMTCPEINTISNPINLLINVTTNISYIFPMFPIEVKASKNCHISNNENKNVQIGFWFQRKSGDSFFTSVSNWVLLTDSVTLSNLYV